MPAFEDLDGNILTEPLSIGDLLSTGKQFEIHSENIRPVSHKSHNDFFDDFGMDSDDDDAPSVDPQTLISPWHEPFEKLRPKMIKINDYLYKQIVHEGRKDSKIATENARVSIQYTSYAEQSTQTFDSTYLRGRPHTFNTGKQEILPGIEHAVRTMKLEEESQFVISYQLLYGEMGCPPRIPPKTDYLFVIKVLRIEEVGDANAMDNVADDDKTKFEIVFPKIKEIHKKGVDYFNLKNYTGALNSFHHAVRGLEMCTLKNETEEVQFREFMVKLYTNLATIYSILDQPARVCSMCNDMRSISLNLYRKNPKALYREGKALSDLGEYERAKKKLLEAKHLSPANEDINAELEKLNTRKAQYLKQNQEICARAFGLHNVNENSSSSRTNQNNDEDELITQEMREIFESFKSDDTKNEIPLDNFTLSEIRIVENLIKEMGGLKLTTTVLNKKKYLTKIQ